MQRVLVIGCGGSGKTRLARELAARAGLPLVHLDREYWRPGWAQPSPEEWELRIRALIAADAWILDGNYGGTLALRLSRADTAIFLDVPTATCLLGIFGRYVRWRGTVWGGNVRPDLPEGCVESIDLEFARYVLGYRRARRARVLDQLNRFDGDVVVLRSRRAARRYAATGR